MQLSIPLSSVPGRKLRLKGRGLPGKLQGDLCAVLAVALPPSVTEADPQQLQVLVAAGLLKPMGHEVSWQFAGEALPLTHQALRLARDLEL